MNHIVLVLSLGLAACHGPPITSSDRVALARPLPPLDGARLAVSVVEVTYAPGDASKPHHHPCPVVGYVVDGAVRMQVAGQREVIYQAGDTFYEGPNETHLVSANASDNVPATFIAVFTCDHDGPLSVAGGI